MFGRLLQLRGMINLHSEILDTPDFARENHDQLFTDLWEHLDMNARIELLNKRLDYGTQVMESINKTSTHFQILVLNVIIALLICFEVGLLVKQAYQYLTGTSKQEVPLQGPDAAHGSTGHAPGQHVSEAHRRYLEKFPGIENAREKRLFAGTAGPEPVHVN